jgi:hypothetical protein
MIAVGVDTPLTSISTWFWRWIGWDGCWGSWCIDLSLDGLVWSVEHMFSD